MRASTAQVLPNWAGLNSAPWCRYHVGRHVHSAAEAGVSWLTSVDPPWSLQWYWLGQM